MIRSVLSWCKGEPHDSYYKARQAFYNEINGDDYDFWQYAMDMYTLEDSFRSPFYKVQALNGRLYTLESALEFVRFVKEDAISLKAEEAIHVNDLIVNNGDIVAEPDFKARYGMDLHCQTFNEVWQGYRHDKARCVSYVVAMIKGNIVVGGKADHLLTVFDVSLENALHIYEQYCRYLRDRVDIMLDIKSGLVHG